MPSTDAWPLRVLPEHHFLEEYSHSSAPEVFLAAVSQRTKRLRLGHGIVRMPPDFNHPARVAELVLTPTLGRQATRLGASDPVHVGLRPGVEVLLPLPRRRKAKLGTRIGRLADDDLLRLNRALMIFLGLAG